MIARLVDHYERVGLSFENDIHIQSMMPVEMDYAKASAVYLQNKVIEMLKVCIIYLG